MLELMSVAFLPVPTGILGTWVVSDRNRVFAVLFNGGTLAVLGIFHNLLWWHGAYKARLTSPALTPPKRRALTLTWMVGPVLYAIYVGLAWFDPRVSLAGFVLLGLVSLLPTPRVLTLAQRTRESRRVSARRRDRRA
jgi:uncharacterized membrane protein